MDRWRTRKYTVDQGSRHSGNVWYGADEQRGKRERASPMSRRLPTQYIVRRPHDIRGKRYKRKEKHVCVCCIYGRNESELCDCCIVRAPEQILLQPSKAYTVVDSCNDPQPHPLRPLSVAQIPEERVYAMLLKKYSIPGYHGEKHQDEAELIVSTW